MSAKKQKPVSPSALSDFKKLVRKAIFLSPDEEHLFQSIPNDNWSRIFSKNFNGNLNYAKRVLLRHYDEIESIDQPRVDAEKKKIRNLGKAASWIADAVERGEPVIVVTDFDNDGSLSQAVAREYLIADKERPGPFLVEYAQTVNGNSNRGFTVDVVDRIVEMRGIDPQSPFLLVTADNGINSREEQEKIRAKYPQSRLIVTDHHLPEDDMVVLEDASTIIFNPKHHPTPFFEEFNVAGAATFGILMKEVLRIRLGDEALSSPNVKNIDELSRVSNLLDYVDTDPVDKPQRDYVASKFLKLQPLLNINNSLSKIILDGMPSEVLDSVCKKADGADRRVIEDEVRNIRVQNNVAKVLLGIHKAYEDGLLGENPNLDEDALNEIFAVFSTNPEFIASEGDLNRNHIEQLRPLIFAFSVDDEKPPFLSALNEKMMAVFENLRVSEKRVADEIRKGEVVTRVRRDNSVISFADPVVTSVFNRKYLNKIYNDENPGFSLMLDNVGKDKVSGSFRSLYDIADILSDKPALEKKLGVRIETPGHERAAGFIVRAEPGTVITEKTIDAISEHIDSAISKLKAQETNEQQTHLLVDLSSIKLVDRINFAVKGNLANFERVVPLLRIDEDTVWTDSYSTRQFSMKEICDERKYGYVSIKTDFHGGTVIIPIELVRRLVETNYAGYLSVNYMDGGVFMAERVLPEATVVNVVDLRDADKKTALIREVFSTEFNDSPEVKLDRSQILDNPFFKYNDYGDADFDRFEKMVIGIIDANDVDELAVFDVEANGFGNSKIMNIGAMNYSISQKGSSRLREERFNLRFFHVERGEQFILSSDQISELKEISQDEKSLLPMDERRRLLLQTDPNGGVRCFRHPWEKQIGDNPPFIHVRNYKLQEDGYVVFNRKIEARMSAFLINDDDFRVPQEMTNLTGITQELLREFGTPTADVDAWLAKRYEGKKVIFGAHNTPYDSRVVRANLPLFHETLKKSKIYDSAAFSRKKKLAYDNVTVAKFNDVPGIPSTVAFYDNDFSDFTLSKFLSADKDGLFPDRSGRYVIERANGEWFFIDKQKHDKNKLQIDSIGLQERVERMPLPDTNAKYSVEALSAQWMVRALLLSDEKFDIKKVDPYINAAYENLYASYGTALDLFQEHYDFSASIGKNIDDFRIYHEGFDDAPDEIIEVLHAFATDFVNLNGTIAAKFADAWIYKKVLAIKDPRPADVTKDLIELVCYQTDLPETKVREVFSAAIKFKEKYGIESVLQHEGHVNGPFKGDDKGDVAFEDKLTLTMLAQRSENAYSRDIDNAVREFCSYAVAAQSKFDVAELMADGLADDSYSYRQGLLYNRKSKTDLVKGIQEREAALSSDDATRVVKFKLDEGILQSNRHLVALKKDGAVISRKDIEKDAKMFGFILLNEQIRNSLVAKKISEYVESHLSEILVANDDLSMRYKKELAERYCYVALNRREHQFKNLLSVVQKRIEKGEMSPVIEADPVVRTKLENKIRVKSDDLNSMDFENVIQVLSKMAVGNGWNKEIVDSWTNWIEQRAASQPQTELERVLETPPTSFASTTSVRDDLFLKMLEIDRENPLKNLFGTEGYRMTNLLVEKIVERHGDEFAKRSMARNDDASKPKRRRGKQP